MIITRLSILTKDKHTEVIDLNYYEFKDFFGNMYHAFADASELTVRNEDGSEKKIAISDIIGVSALLHTIPDSAKPKEQTSK